MNGQGARSSHLISLFPLRLDMIFQSPFQPGLFNSMIVYEFLVFCRSLPSSFSFFKFLLSLLSFLLYRLYLISVFHFASLSLSYNLPFPLKYCPLVFTVLR